MTFSEFPANHLHNLTLFYIGVVLELVEASFDYFIDGQLNFREFRDQALNLGFIRSPCFPGLGLGLFRCDRCIGHQVSSLP